MSKKKTLFAQESDDDTVCIKTDNEYAKKYDSWREKEELHKLEQKYGTNPDPNASGSSDSEDESDGPPEVSEEMETQFLKTLALLKTKDPRIYDPQFKCFENTKKEEEKKSEKKTLSFADSDDDSDSDREIFTIEKKAEIKPEPEKEKNTEGQLKEYLTGQADHVDEEIEKDLAPLKALWSDPKLNDGEAFLRDYILNKRYLEEGDVGDNEDLEADEEIIEEQGKFERAYNFRFEEPDQEFLKRYPRTMNFIRPKDDRRAKKRAEVRTRKEEEKQKKMEEIGRMKALKLKEIQEKIAKIKEVTGNDDLAFEEQDIEGDFDPEEHDRRMKALFDEKYYGDVDVSKPVFPDLDEELEIENWDKYEEEAHTHVDQQTDEPYCGDDDFNMDADYDPKQAFMQKLIESQGKKRRNRKKKSKLAELLASEKPKFIPTVANKTYDQYMEEYYKMDCEDVIGGDLPTRFKYREVVPNDFGLTIEEILLADDNELTQWVPLKKIVKHRPSQVEKSEVNTYRQKAADESLKKKILPSLFKDLPEKPEIAVPLEQANKKKKKKNKNKAEEQNFTSQNEDGVMAIDVVNNIDIDRSDTKPKKKKKNKHECENVINNENKQILDEANLKIVLECGEKTKGHKKEHHNETTESVEVEIRQNMSKKKNKPKKEHANEALGSNEVKVSETISNKRKKRKNRVFEENLSLKPAATHEQNGFVIETISNNDPSQKGYSNVTKNTARKRKLDDASNKQMPNQKKKKHGIKSKLDKNGRNRIKNSKKHSKDTDNPLSKLSDERLKAYGLNPKKYRSFLKYKKF